MAKSYLDYDGLLYLWQKIKTLFASKDEAMTSAEKTKLSGIAAGAEVNQNAFSNVKVPASVGTSMATIAADAKTDTLTIMPGDNITLTADTNSDMLTIGATDTKYSDFTGATSSAAGAHGLVPAPAETDLVLLSNGNWAHMNADIIRVGNSGVPLMQIVTSKAGLASPEFTGTPKAPTASAGTNNTQIATTAFVTKAINNAIGDITGLSFEVVTALPTTGVAGTIYLLSNGGSGQNIYDEYVWVNNKFEKIGTTDVDLSGYLQTTDVVAITNAEIDTILAS